MKKTILITILSILFYSCNKNPLCSGDNINEGLIESEFPNYCMPRSEKKEFIIQDEATMQEIFGQDNECAKLDIDFDKFTLLGVYATGQCQTKYVRVVRRMEEEKQYHYTVIVHDCGICKKMGYSHNWVTVPKLPEGWTVVFATKNE